MSVTQASARSYRPGINLTDKLVSFVLAFMASVTGKFSRLSAAAHRGTLGEQALLEATAPTTRAHISGPVMRIGQAILVAVIILIILGELYATDIVANPTNPNTFTNLTETFASYGETAFIMIGLGLIALGASVALSYFGGFGGGGR